LPGEPARLRHVRREPPAGPAAGPAEAQRAAAVLRALDAPLAPWRAPDVRVRARRRAGAAAALPARDSRPVGAASRDLGPDRGEGSATADGRPPDLRRSERLSTAPRGGRRAPAPDAGGAGPRRPGAHRAGGAAGALPDGAAAAGFRRVRLGR